VSGARRILGQIPAEMQQPQKSRQKRGAGCKSSKYVFAGALKKLPCFKFPGTKIGNTLFFPVFWGGVELQLESFILYIYGTIQLM
jgi:hypothetical protein